MRNSSYNLIPILLNLCRHCDHALKICMWLGYTCQINFCHFFYNLNLVVFWTFLHLESGLPVGGIVFHKHIFYFYITDRSKVMLIVVLIVLCFGLEFVCCLRLMYVYIFLVKCE